MSKWTKPELENMLEDVVNELSLSEMAIEQHGPEGTAPAELVRLVLEQKDLQIKMLKAGMIQIPAPQGVETQAEKLVDAAKTWLNSQPYLDQSDEEMAIAAWQAAAVHLSTLTLKAPVLAHPGFASWWESYANWDGGCRYLAEDEESYREAALASWEAAKSPITPHPIGEQDPTSRSRADRECPFCGGRLEITGSKPAQLPTLAGDYSWRCVGCGLVSPKIFGTREEAIKDANLGSGEQDPTAGADAHRPSERCPRWSCYKEAYYLGGRLISCTDSECVNYDKEFMRAVASKWPGDGDQGYREATTADLDRAEEIYMGETVKSGTYRHRAALAAVIAAFRTTPLEEGAAGNAEIMLQGANTMIEAIERIIPRNDADRDYADTVRQHVESQAAKLNAAEQRILDLEEGESQKGVRVPAWLHPSKLVCPGCGGKLTEREGKWVCWTDGCRLYLQGAEPKTIGEMSEAELDALAEASEPAFRAKMAKISPAPATEET